MTSTNQCKWALVNLVLSVACLILAIGVAVCVLLQHTKKQKKSQTNEESKKQKKQHSNYWLVAALVMGVAGIVVFLLTEDMTHPMGMVDNWTILQFVLLLVVLIIVVRFVFTRKKNTAADQSSVSSFSPPP